MQFVLLLRSSESFEYYRQRVRHHGRKSVRHDGRECSVTKKEVVAVGSVHLQGLEISCCAELEENKEYNPLNLSLSVEGLDTISKNNL